MIIDLDRRWRARPDLACLGLSETYFPPGPGKPGDRPTVDAQAAWDEAKAVCRRCPVMHQCRRDTMGEPYGVWGGLDQYQRWQVRSRMTAAAKRWPASRRRSWGRVVHELRSRGDGWVMVSVRTGLPVGLAHTLGERLPHDTKQPDRFARVLGITSGLSFVSDLLHLSDALQDLSGRWFRHICVP